jgi:phosphatidylinositol 3-kinase
METVSVMSSADDLDKIRFTIERINFPKTRDFEKIILIANLFSATSPTATRLNLLDRRILLCAKTQRVEVEFNAQAVGPWSRIELEVWSASARDVLQTAGDDGYIGRIIFPVFSPRGILLSGKYLFVLNTDRDRSSFPEQGIVEHMLERKSAIGLNFTNAKADSQTQIIVDQYHFFNASCGCDEIQSPPGEWGLPPVTNESLLEPLAEIAFFRLLINPLLHLTVYADACKGNSHMTRQTSGVAGTPPRTLSPDGLAHIPGVTEPSNIERTRTNWMVINGPIRESIPGRISGTGDIPTVDVITSLSPSPLQIIDYELFKDHPAATKAARIQRSGFAQPVLTGQAGQMRPNADEMARLNDIILQPMRDLSQVEVELILKFVWSLTDKKQALLKALLAVVTSGISDDIEAVVTELIESWAPVDIDGALSLLGEEVGNLAPAISGRIRGYAVDRLAAVATKRELQLYMFQLVQSLRYEQQSVYGEQRLLSSLLIDRAGKDAELASLLFWYLQCESGEAEQQVSGISRLVGFAKDPMSQSGASPLFSRIGQEFWRDLGRTEMGRKTRDGIELQCQFRMRLLDVSRILRVSKVGTTSQTMGSGIDMPAVSNKTEILRETLPGNVVSQSASIISKLNLTNRLNFPIVGGEMVEIPIPLDPLLSLIRVDEMKSFCIKSAKAPFVITCEVFNKRTKATEMRRFMFKTGDDLRQDQLIIQFISLIDGMYKSYGLDLKLSPYKVLATSVDDGFVEFVSDSSTLSSILASNNNDLMAYFRAVRPSEGSPFGIDPNVLDTFSRSCAGYCAITYILGIGDRHMDNLLVTSDGRLFHVDFGYILGRDPKPFPPPMKLCREMVEGMGGQGSVYYRSFVSKCTQAFQIMRRHSNLIISLLYLAADANLKDMREQDPRLAILKVQKRLMPEVSDEVAEQQMINLINESTNALFPVVIEKLHKYAMYWRQ